jgi:hypothetical protein
MGKTLAWMVLLIALVVGFASFSHYCSIFVMPPVEAMPAGGTLVVWRGKGAQIIDSADAVCERLEREATSFCRIEALRRASADGILLRLPYFSMLDRIARG